MILRVVGQRPLSVPASACLVFLISLAIHESGHVLAFRTLAPRSTPTMLVTRRSAAFVVRPVLTRARDSAVTLAGPVLPALASLPAWWLVGRWPVEVAMVLLVAAGHLGSLAFPSGDGRALGDAPSSPTGRPGPEADQLS